MSDGSPAVPRGTHLQFLADSRCMDEDGPSLTCVLCGTLDADFGCERCGAPFHGDCHLDRAMSAAERAIFQAAVAEREVASAPRLDAAMLHNLATLAEALAVPLAEMLETIYPPGPAEQAVGHLVCLCRGCRQ